MLVQSNPPGYLFSRVTLKITSVDKETVNTNDTNKSRATNK